jgi:hypothetical protein
MIGFSSILAELIFPLGLGVFFLCYATWGLTEARERKLVNVFNRNELDYTNTLAFVLIFSVIWLGLFANRALREGHLHSELRNLRPEAVESIEIGGQTVTDRKEIGAIVTILNHSQWYSLRRGDAADQIPFVIKLADGRHHSYQIARYLRGEGAALVSQSPAGWENGEVFCRRLPASLEMAGVTLPPCSTYPGRPHSCATP